MSGPWVWQGSDIYGEDGPVMEVKVRPANFFSPASGYVDVSEANAALIIAAPELLEAALAVVARWDSPKWKDAAHTSDYINKLRCAVAKAALQANAAFSGHGPQT